MQIGFHRIAVINRGEAAMRLINAVHELRFEHDLDLRVLALHTSAERSAMFVREADEAFCLDDGRAPDAGNPYIDLDVLERALVESRADAAWVGWGFVAERPDFAELCERLGVVFIGPRAEVMRQLGDKIGSKHLAERCDVPVAPWSAGPVESIEAAHEHADRIGFPLMIKATAGGGGRGIRRVDDHGGLDEAYASARSEGLNAFGDATVFMERVVSAARHVEVQVIGDTHGEVWALGVRDCSLQRRNQKVIEESHCIALSPDQDREVRAAAVRLAKAAGYENAGTVEFLYQPADQTFAFLEVNTRLQVEHPITELTTGVDLVKLQILVAAGGHLDASAPPSVGYAIEARLNAEDPQRGFAPAPGTIETLALPVGPGIRVDTGVAEGDVIPAEFDSMIAKIIAVGADRDEAFARLRRALAQMTVLVDGGTTNKSFLLELLGRSEVRAGTIDTSWLDRLTADGDHIPTRHADVALVVAALDAREMSAAVERSAFFGSASRGRPLLDARAGHTVELRRDSDAYAVEIRQILPGRYEITVDAVARTVDVERLDRVHSRVTVGSTTYGVVSSTQDSDHLVEVDGVSHRFSRDDAGVVRSPSAALVVRIDVSVDDVVAVGDRLGVLEAMKMELAIVAPVGGRIRDVFSMANAQVVAGLPLFRIEPDSADAGTTTGRERITITAFDEGAAVGAAELVRASLLGYDVSTARACAIASTTLDIDGAELVAMLEMFADLSALDPERVDAGSEERGGREYFNRYLRSLDPEREGVPQWYVDRLLRALAHYGVTDLGPGDDVVIALYRIFVSQQRREEQFAIVAALLENPRISPPLRHALDRVIDATRRRSPAITGLARSVRYRLFDRPLIEQAHADVATAMKQLVASAVASRDSHSPEVDGLVDCPLPLMPILADDDVFATTHAPGMLIEILIRRYYRIRALDPVRVDTVDGLEVCRSRYTSKGNNVHVIAARVPRANLAEAIPAIALAAETITAPDTAVMDVFLPLRAADAVGTDALAADVLRILAAADLPDAIRRVSVIPAQVGETTQLVTFRRADVDGVRPYWMTAPSPENPDNDPLMFEEDIKFRGLHPMIARRLQMWRLANFVIAPLPAAGETHLFDCVARDNPSDRRLIAVAEVRDLTPIFDDAGKVVALPEVEHQLVGCLDAIRRARSELPRAHNLEWNRVMLHVWPTVEFPLDELDEVVRRLAPMTEGLGLEQVILSGRVTDAATGATVEAVMRIGQEPGRGMTVRITDPPTEPMQALNDYDRKLIATRRRGLTYPYEIIPMLTRGGTFVEYELAGADNRLEPIERPRGENPSGIIVGVVSTPTGRYPEGMKRVALFGDPTRAMGSITEAECRRLLGAIDLATELGVPIEWFALSAGAKISMDSGSENLDWVARVLRRIVEHTQAGGEINVVVAGINVGAQPYWNAESTMLMHTRGILVMTPDSAMVLTGKQAIDYSGGVSAEDNFGIGGYERIMGPNGEAQYWAPSLAAACDLLFRHYELTYRAPGERWARPAPSTDPSTRDVRSTPHVVDGVEFTTVGDIFSDTANPDRKKPFDIRTLMNAVIDADHAPLERWREMVEAEMAVVYDCRLGGSPVTLIGMESRPLPRHGMTPADGPAQWSAGTLFPLSSKKVARAINAASGARPVVMLANLSGFDGSPESLRRLQLEYGAEIGRAIVNFDGPFVLCVVSRYHGGAFVVFSATLNDSMEVLAVDGSFASVIGGAPAAAVVFTREVDARTAGDERIRELEAAIAAAGAADADEADRLEAQLSALHEVVRTEKMGDVAAEFDAVHSVQRAREVGSVHRIITAADLRPELIASIERGMSHP